MRKPQVSRVLVSVGLQLSLIGPWTLQAIGTPASSRPIGRLSPPSGALLGMHVQPRSGSGEADLRAAVDGIESDIGRRLAIDSHYYGWSDSFPSWKESWDLARGRTPMISWAGSDPASIALGAQDETIRARADGVKALNQEVFVRWFPDMDDLGALTASGSPGGFVAAWRHIHDLFQARGATKAVWVWCPTAEGFKNGLAPAFYPGDEYVDWICADGFNLAPGKAGAPWETFQTIFDPFYAWASSRAKPLMIGESGVQEDAPGRKAAWLADVATTLSGSYESVEAFVYFDAMTSYDWRLDTSSSAYDAFKTLARSPSLNPLPGALLGAYVEPRTGWTKADTKAAIDKLEADIGRPLDIDQHYYRWDLSFPSWREPWDISTGRIPMITWGSTSTSQVNSGSQDALIAARADGIKSLGAPVFLRWFGEMDATALAAKAGKGPEFITAWRRIHGIFDARGAENAVWVWCPTSYGFDVGRAASYYPGDAYVDWICADGYNWAPKRAGATWTSFETIFDKFYQWAAPREKPIMVGETGTEERNPGEKAQWIAEAGAAIRAVYPKIRALLYFDASEPDFSGPEEFDWRLDTSTSSYEAFRALAADPYFHPSHASILPA